ncbi:hypothetical protein IF1G_02011 [Cordyceps javanica]|uniref:Uncharacterized protein n=1 Tax=Cordyceps javanica TaxID=43265 RepID=A0A545VDJ4_9HYPO|nr:hypothetical protein IF1G_02011 [Cordyceps javanica]
MRSAQPPNGQRPASAEGKTYQVRVLELLNDRDVVKLDVEVLVHALQRTPELDIVLELYSDLLVDERLEEAVARSRQRNSGRATPVSQQPCLVQTVRGLLSAEPVASRSSRGKTHLKKSMVG